MEFINNKLYSDSSLVSYYRLEGDGNDEKGTNNFTSTGVTYSSNYGVFGQGGSFDGTVNSYLMKTSFSGFPTTELTVSCWVKTSDDNCGIISYASTSSDNEVLLFHNGNQLSVYIRGVAVASNVVFNDNNWNHCTLTWKSTTGKTCLYKNGKLVFSAIVSSGVSLTGDGALVVAQEQDSVGGGFDGAQAMSGYVDEICLFNRELTAFEVYGLYSGQFPLELKETPLYNDSSLIGLWRLEGNNTDSKGGLACTDYNISYSAAKFGQGAVFNGSSSRIDIANSTNYDVTKLTMSAWVYSTNFVHNGFIFEKGSVNTQYSMFFEGANFVFRTMPSAGGAFVDLRPISASLGITNNNWHHVVCTYDGGIKRVYVNGQLRVSAVYTAGLMTGQSGERIGAYGGATPSYWFNGSIDDVAVFNRALSAKEILGLYEGTLAKYSKNTLSKYRKDRFVGYIEKGRQIENTPLFNDPNLIGYWKLDGNSLDSKASNNGTDTAMTYPEENSHWGKPAKFNGSTSHISVTNINHQASDFSYSWWTKWDKTPVSSQTYIENGSWTNCLLIRQGNYNVLHVYSMNTFIGDFNFVPIVGKWHHLCLVRSGNTLYLYADGQLCGTLAFSITITPSANMWFGASQHSSTQCITGYMVDVAVFSRALTEAEIRQICFGFKELNNLQDYKRLENNEVNPEIEECELISPTDISGCKVWIDISKINYLVDGNAISSAPDLSGNGNNLAQITAPQNPIYKTNVLNGLATMRGTIAATTTFLIPWTYLSPSSIFYIARQTSSNGRLLSGRTNNWLMGYHGGYKDRAYYEGWIDEAVNRQTTNSNWYVWTGICNTSSYLMENGKVVKYGTTGVTAPAGMCIGYLGASEFSDFDIGEIIGYNRDLSSRERELVSNYLLKKWGMDYNVALMKPVSYSPSSGWAVNNPWNVTDGSTWTDSWFGLSGAGTVTIDLLKIYQVNRVDIFHYWNDGRTYYYNTVETSPDGVTWTTRFDSEVNGRYAETYEGKTITFTVAPVRYVRHSLNGSTANVGSHFTEVRVMGK